jgi:cytochrome c oxidase subunit 2
MQATSPPPAAANPSTLPLVGRPHDVSLDGHRIDHHFDLAALGVTILFVVMVGIMATAMLRHRESAGARASYFKGDKKKHAMFVAGFCLSVFAVVDGSMLFLSFSDLNNVFWKYPTTAETVKVEILAQQWAWTFRYAGPDGKFGTEDDYTSINELRIPVGRPVIVRMRSLDVIHSFYLPNFRVKQDVVPGTTSQLWFQATEAGTFDIGCAQHCGANHYKMHAKLVIEPQDSYVRWESQAFADANRKYDATDVAANWGWNWGP